MAEQIIRPVGVGAPGFLQTDMGRGVHLLIQLKSDRKKSAATFSFIGTISGYIYFCVTGFVLHCFNVLD